MIKKTIQNIERLYTGNLEKYGKDPKSLGWKDEASQVLRFEKLVECLYADMKRGPANVSDLGCGYGSLYDFLTVNGIKISNYYGYDISKKMIDAASSRLNNKNCRFICDSQMKIKCDYSFASGIFNVSLGEKSKTWEAFMKETLGNMNEVSQKGFAFNAMTKYVDFKDNDLYYADPEFWFGYCKNNFSKKVNLIHDYPLWEFTIVVKK
ncbi:MAG: methyltransferase domain-containing protein [Candidatus Paceibacterota bacterium]